MKRIRKHSKMIAVLLVSIQLLELMYPLYSFALTGGPSSPEVQQATPAGEQQLVNLFSGDLSYNIPLLDVGGYAVSISYNSDAVKMESEASCVGLGWNLDIGSISREVRGLPDDFNGDLISKQMNMRPAENGGASLGFDVEFTGFSAGDAQRAAAARESGEESNNPLKMGGGLELGVSRSTYEGWEMEFGYSQEQEVSGETGDFNLSGSLSQSFSINNKEGAGYGFGANFSGETGARKNKATVGVGLGLDVNARDGVKALEISPSVKWQRKIETLDHRKFKGGHGYNFKFPVSFASPSYTPSWEMPRNTDAIGWSIKLGGEVPLTHLSGTVKGHYSKTYLQQNKDSLPAYGYIYSQNSGEGKNLLDFNREEDRAFTAELPNLPLTQFTHDVYTVSGQGLGGSFRPFRSDCGTLHDAYNYQNNTAGNVGGEIGIGQLVKGGVDFKIIYTHSETKKWTDGNQFNSAFSFKGSSGLTEAVYFKNMGEATCMANPEQFDAIGGFRPIRAEVGNNGTTTNTLRFNGDEVFSGYNTENIQKRNREPRNTNFSFLTAEKAAHNGLDRGIKSYQPGSPVFADRDDVPTDLQPVSYRRTSLYRKSHHISEVTVTRGDGARYVYGVPAYNIFSTDYTFNVSGIAALPDGNKLISYESNPQVRSVNNKNGLDRYFEKETTPAHPYAWMLSGVLSDDYVDLTGNGMSPDDLGNYTKINYQLTNSNYKWRTPYGRFQANFQENSKSDENDNYASFTYGAKEIWNVHSIETRNLVAEFFYSKRKDAYAVLDVDGGVDVRSTLVKLDSIKLYAKNERLEKGDAAVPLKKVVFNYNYELCKGIPNTTEAGIGKLTLASLYFTYGTSEKGSRSPYIFTYSDENPDYKPKSVDKWGNYIKKEEGQDAAAFNALPKNKADKYASAWLLTGIKNPEGSNLQISYECDDYAYVQDRRAMEMFTIKGLSTEAEKNAGPLNDNEDELVYNGSTVYNYVKFELKKPAGERTELIRYVQNIRELFFTGQMDLSGNLGKFEKVDGFIPVSLNDFNTDFGFCTAGETVDGKYKYAWIRLPRISAGDSNAEEATGVQPMAKAAWQKIRKSMPEMIYNDPNPMSDDPIEFVNAVGNMLLATEGFFRDPNAVLSNGAHASKLKSGKGKIRLNSPDLIKFGGGARVKKITVTDNWDTMSGVAGTSSVYGTEYFYTTKTNINGVEMEISSGVNAYEPMTNADENPFQVPTRYTVEKPLSIDYSLYFSGPVGEIFFPGAGIGYSKVKVRNLQHESVTKNATGFSVHEYYTAKDFPTLTAQTDLQVNPKEVPFPPFYSEKQATVSQGFSVELNNMHGQQKAIHIFQETDSVNPISGQQFFYKTDARGNLSNRVSVVDPSNGNVTYQNFGVEYEMYADARESVAETYGPSAQINADGFLAAMIPVTIPMVYPNMNFAFKRYRALTFTKVIHRSGILDRIVSYNNGANASVSTSVFDKQTGEAVVTETENEFGRKEYALSIPAYWIYSGMDAAYKNQGLCTDITMPALGDYRSKFHVGDELLIHNYSSFVPEVIPGITGRTVAEPPKKAWVLSVNEVGLSLIDGKGNPITTAGRYSVEILRSGRRNHLKESAGSVLSLTNPVVTSGSAKRLEIPTDNVINATAGEYSDLWQTYAAFQSTQPQYQCNCREFSNKIGTTSKTALEQFLKSLMTRGDFSRTGISLTDAPYSSFGSFMQSVLGSRPRSYNGYEGATEFRGEVLNADSTNCHFTVEMADGTTLFPDSVIDFRIDLSLTDEIDRGACDNANTALGIITYRGGFNNNTSHVPSSGFSAVTARVRITTTCFPILNCIESYVGEGALTCAASGSGTVNPFVSDIMGCWRKKTDYAFRSERNITTVADGGVLNNFRSFFTGFPLMVKPATDRDRANWQPAGTATTYDPYGRNLESKNSLGIYSSEVFGYGFSLPVLAAQNSRYMNAAFDGFEDYQYKNLADNPWNDCPVTPHFRFDTSVAKVVRDVSHTGYSSLKTSVSVTLTRDFFPLADATFPTIAGGRFTANKNNLIQPFIPDTLNYFFSAWISKGVPGAASGGFGFIPISPPGGGSGSGLSGSNFLQNLGSNLGINVPQLTGGVGTILGGAGLLSTYDVVIKARTSSGGEITLVSANAEGKSVDGWRQINATFKVPSNVQSLTVQLNANGKQTWFDDVRIQPFNSSMKTFVYDPNTLRLMAMLDENNFASIYEYDNEGNLVRTKKETEDNIVTLQEIRSAKPKTR